LTVVEVEKLKPEPVVLHSGIIVIVLDRSTSMKEFAKNGRTRWENAISGAQELIR
jgi:hypothetical protein